MTLRKESIMFIKILYLYSIIVMVENSVIVTTSGPVLGKFVENDLGVSYYAYQGIPYAENPGGRMRFKPPVPKKPWLHVLNARREGPICPQPGDYAINEMSEDCLTLNIYVPATNSRSLRQAYVFIHGGAFKSNSGNIDEVYGPQLLLTQNIIVITLNYRLGALGFLSLEQEKAPGNAGIKDVLLALQWINKNIERFGGKEITIGGQSAGAAIVHYLLLSEKSTGLFQRAVLNSGSATNFRYLSRYPKDTARALASQLGIESDEEDEILEKLLTISATDIVTAQENIYKNNRNAMRPFAPFVPTIEEESANAILTKDPTDIIKSGIPQDVPLLLGITSQEGTYMYTSLKNMTDNFLRENFMLCLPSDIEYPRDSQVYKDLMESIDQIYFGKSWNLDNFFNLLSDTQYSSSVDSWIRIHLQRNGNKSLYYYVFDFEGDFNWAKLKYNISFPGMAHADDLGYMFVTKITKSKLFTANNESRKTMENTLKHLINFIKYGNPNGNSKNDMKWSECGETRSYMLLKDEPEMMLVAPYQERFDFWYNAYREYEVYLKKGGIREKSTIT